MTDFKMAPGNPWFDVTDNAQDRRDAEAHERNAELAAVTYQEAVKRLTLAGIFGVHKCQEDR